MAIYTKRGDKGETSVYDQGSTQRDRISKNSLRISVIGRLDELNSYLGVVISRSEDEGLNKKLKEVQRNLLTAGSIIAGSKLRFFATKTAHLEREIDELERKLPVLKNFILPGGTKVAANLQYARTLARRAERTIVALNEKVKVKPQILTYLNRLSDYLFMQARFVNHRNDMAEETWAGGKH